MNQNRCPKYENKLLEDLKLIKEVPFTKEDIDKIIKYFKEVNYNKKLDKYNLFTQKQINNDYENSIKFVIEFLKNNILGEI